MKSASSKSLTTSSLVVPMALGGAMFLLIAAALDGHIIDNDLARRYLVGHPISRTTTFLFCVGLVSLVGLIRNVVWQSRTVSLVTLNPKAMAESSEGTDQDDVEAARELSSQLKSLPQRLHGHYLYQRLSALLSFIDRNGSSELVDGELKFQSECAQVQQQQRLSFVKILIWATPMLGFLGTVIGISEALSHLNVGADNDLQAMMSSLQNSLYVAFDTTAQALILSMALMFLMFFEERLESQLLERIDERATAEIANCFEFSSPKSTPAENGVQRLGKKMLAATRAAVHEHTRIWKKTIESAEKSWTASQTELSSRSREELTQALRDSLSDFSSHFQKISAQADQNLSLRLGQWQTMLSDNSRSLEVQQTVNSGQCNLLSEILDRLTASRELSDKEWESRRRAMEDAQQHEATVQQQWEQILNDHAKFQEMQHAQFQKEMKLLNELLKKFDGKFEERVAAQSDNLPSMQEVLSEIVSLLQMMKEEVADLQQDRRQSDEQKVFRLRIAENTRNAA